MLASTHSRALCRKDALTVQGDPGCGVPSAELGALHINRYC